MNLYDLTMKISFTIIFYDWNLLENRFQVETQRNEKPVQYEGYAEVVSRSREYVIQMQEAEYELLRLKQNISIRIKHMEQLYNCFIIMWNHTQCQ